MEIRLFVIIGMMTFCWVIISYYDYAKEQSLPVHKIFHPEKALGFKLFAFIVGVYFIFTSGKDFGWIYSIISPVSSFFIAFLFIRFFGKSVQIISVVGFIILFLLNILLQVEVVSV
ncbi:MAG: hypothetical protein HWE07_05100 [Cytophagia bacterium]|nr:hypothetical protein [Cytophagia bacterium]